MPAAFSAVQSVVAAIYAVSAAAAVIRDIEAKTRLIVVRHENRVDSGLNTEGRIIEYPLHERSRHAGHGVRGKHLPDDGELLLAHPIASRSEEKERESKGYEKRCEEQSKRLTVIPGISQN
jgi:hypothetical protein